MNLFVIRKPHKPQDSSPTQDSSSKHGYIDMNNLLSDPGQWEMISFCDVNIFKFSLVLGFI